MFDIARFVLAGTLLSSPALSHQAPSGPPTYDAVFEADQTYSGQTTFTVGADGKVSGTMKLSSPATVNAALNGVLKEGQWTFNYAFTMDMQGQPCAGTVDGKAKVTADLKVVEGTATVSGDCLAQPMPTTFTFKQRAR